MAKFLFKGSIVMIGYGSVGRCTMPLIERHFDMPLSRVTVIDGHDHRTDAKRFIDKGMKYIVDPLYEHNLLGVLSKHAKRGDIILNLSVEVDSLAVITWCQKHGVLYEDTCIEPWANYYDNTKIPEEQRTNYYLRHRVLEAARRFPKGGASALLTHGANPGLITHFIKQAALDIARKRRPKTAKPTTRAGWAKLMRAIGVKVIHVAEHDLQVTNLPKRQDEFCNTWSIPGFVGEGSQPAELGWGSHEKRLPANAGKHKVGSKSAIYLRQPGCITEVRSWTPQGGPMIGFLVTHGESITTSDYFTVFEKGKAVYRPTVHYAYHPCDDAVLSVREYQMKNFRMQPSVRLLNSEITDGIDELGALLMGDFGAYWYGSQLSIHEARKIMGPDYNATSIQIAAPVLAGAMWLAEHPNEGVVEPEQLDHDYILDVCRPYLGPVVGCFSDWTPLKDRNVLFPEPGLDLKDPWQFQNFRVQR
jgi:homospermidine synthase